MKILLTGVAGFIGSHVANQLLKRGDTVVGIDNFNDYYDPNQKWANSQRLESFENFQLVPMDICDLQRQLFLEHDFDAVIHLAAMAGVRNSVKCPSLYFNVNLTASQNLVELAREFEIGNFVFASTSSTYGNTCRIPFVESDPCTEPLHPYSTSKRTVEHIGYTYNRNYGTNFTSLRFFTVYGPSGRPDMMPFLVARSIVTGEPVPLFQGDFQRDWTYIDDIVDGVVTAVDRPLGYEIINLGRGKPELLSAFVHELESVAGHTANLISTPAPKTEMLTTYADISKARRLLDFEPRVSIEEGVEEFWNWFCQQEIKSKLAA